MRFIVHTLALSALLIAAATGISAGSALALRSRGRRLTAGGRELAARLIATALAAATVLTVLAAE